MPDTLRTWAATHIDEQFSEVVGQHNNELFYNCDLGKINKAQFVNCVMDKSKVLTDKLEDVMGLVVSMDCGTFSGVELSETVFLAFVALLLKTKGNTELRSNILNAVGRDKMVEVLHKFVSMEL